MKASRFSLSWRALAIALALLAFVSTACRVNELPTYLPRVENAYVINIVPAGPVVDFGVSEQQNLGAAILTQVVSSTTGEEVREKVEASAQPEELADALYTVFAKDLNSSLGLEVVGDNKMPHDTRLEITIARYGLTAVSPESEIFYFFEVDARMVYIPENKLIWEFDDTLAYPLKDFHVYSNVGAIQAFSAASNLSALNDLSTEDMRALFLDMAATAGHSLVEQMRYDSTN